mgnify:CR=1 FL=1
MVLPAICDYKANYITYKDGISKMVNIGMADYYSVQQIYKIERIYNK